jgi:BirA family transcriptional regulator, biotin operon repressor / biotin---[acetyl-CoA-carboxylase] ligase
MKISESGLFQILADGRFHSGQELADSMGVSRAAVWKHLDSLRDKGAELLAVRGKGYRLAAPVEMLDTDFIRSGLTVPVANSLQELSVFYQIASTNLLLREQSVQRPIHAHVVFAEYQTEGRGRGNNVWLGAPGAGLYVSIGWHFDSVPASLSALSLATGVVLAEALADCGADGVRLKWPNDLVHDSAKLGGILIESRGQLAGAVDVIIGIGINVAMPVGLAAHIQQKVTDLSHVCGERPSRNHLAACIINRLFTLLNSYEEQGFCSYIDKWRSLDITCGNNAVLLQSTGSISGKVIDIDDNGFLIMSVNGNLTRFSSGDLSLRVTG